MSQKVNHRRGAKRHQDNGPTYESHTPNAGSNSGHVARGRKNWKRIKARAERRTSPELDTTRNRKRGLR